LDQLVLSLFVSRDIIFMERRVDVGNLSLVVVERVHSKTPSAIFPKKKLAGPLPKSKYPTSNERNHKTGPCDCFFHVSLDY
jgi:hypothetical protein